MNFQAIRNICGQVLKFEAGFMTLSLLVALLYREYRSAAVFAGVIVVMAALSLLLTRRKPESSAFFAREGVITVSLSWVIISLFGAMPFLLSGTIPSFIDSLFESVSGFTTTGATILADVESVDRSMLFWRSFTHWIGGMGVLMFVVAILPMAGADPLHMMRAESPGPMKEKLVPKARQTAKILYSIYIGMTLLQIILLLAGGMPLFDSVVHTLATAGTGGFSIKNASIGAYRSAYIDAVITIFMILFGINFSAYFLLLTRQFKRFLTQEELRWYIGILLVAMLIITVNLTGTVYQTATESFRYASFQVASLMTTTGYATANYDNWPTLSKWILMLIMYIGACAGSTGGGIKVSRIIIILKTLKRQALRIIHPRAVSLVKLDGIPVDESVSYGTSVFIIAIVLISAVSALIVSIDGFDMETSASAVVACINNVGPGLGMVSPAGNFSSFSPLSKIVLSLDMLIGRLEVYPILLLLSPAIWSKRLVI
ncbi:MAG: TrkH family potassium uptake protein [Christensenellales bacterium]|jgi:trk system potassium uptake protein TrkH